MPTGLAYLREIGMKVVNDEVLKISLPTITETVEAGQVSDCCVVEKSFLLLVEVFFLWGKFDLFYVFPPGTIF
jgi:hypothetical protein